VTGEPTGPRLRMPRHSQDGLLRLRQHSVPKGPAGLSDKDIAALSGINADWPYVF
jgi:hypothetical protein